jgi:hypothetical protein
VVYRTGANDRAEYLTTFMDILRGPDQDLFTWDDVDNSKFLWVLANKHQLTLYPQDWNEFMVEIPLKTWLQINNMTQIDTREWTSTDDDTPFRVAAVLLKYLPIPMAREKILPTLGIELEDYGIAFDIMACAVDRDYQNWSALANFDLEEFWTSASLEDWLSACDEALCHGVWHTPMPLLERVQLMIQANNILPYVSSSLLSLGLGAQRQGYVEFGYIHIFTHAAITQPWIPVHLHRSEVSIVLTTIRFSGYEVLKQLEHLGPSFAGYLGVLQNYRNDVQILVREVKKSIEVLSLSEESWLSFNLVEEFFDQPHNLKKCARAHEVRSLCHRGKAGSFPPRSGVIQGSPIISWDGCAATFGSLTGCKLKPYIEMLIPTKYTVARS